MSIASAIQNAQQKVANAYTAVAQKGGTMPATQDLTNLSNAISTIQTGGGGSTLITKTITANGTYNASSDNADGYSQVTVNVPSSGGVCITREISANGVFQMPDTSFTFSLPSNATDIGFRAMYYAFHSCTGLTSADLSSLTTLNNNYAMSYSFYGCTNLTDVDLSSLVNVSGEDVLLQAFYGCSNLTNVDLSSLESVSGYRAFNNTFRGTGLTNVDLSSLESISGNAVMGQIFYDCANLTSVDLSNLETISPLQAFQYAFNNCTNLTSVDFGSLKTIGLNSSTTNYSQFANAFYNCTRLTTITFPKLEKIYCTNSSSSYGTFYNNNKVQKMYFPKLNTITYGSGASSSNRTSAKNIFYNCSSLTELHFGAANQSAIQASPGYSTAWGRGAGNVTIYFDL